MKPVEPNEKPIHLLLARLERIPADSYWAHRASGVRGSLLRLLEKMEKGQPIQTSRVSALVKRGFEVLEEAAREKTKKD